MPGGRRSQNQATSGEAAAGEGSELRPRSSRPQPAVDLHIEELVLHGFPPGDRFPIGDSVESELAMLLAGQGSPEWFADGGEVEEVDAGSFRAEPRARPRTIGTQIARAVYGGLKK
jgi:hypothetical protein